MTYHGWTEETTLLNDGRKATIYINPKAILKVLYLSNETDTAYADVWQAVDEYVRAYLSLQDAQIGDPTDEHAELRLDVQEAKDTLDKLLKRFLLPSEKPI